MTQTRKLGNSGLQITPVGFGAWAIGGAGWDFGWGPQEDADSIAAIHRALDLGVNWIDTAAVYAGTRKARSRKSISPSPYARNAKTACAACKLT
jgi:aryl-alcohol dehydrogenase-like predicted oxidoreductase